MNDLQNPDNPKTLTRKSFLRLIATGLGLSTLASCTPSLESIAFASPQPPSNQQFFPVIMTSSQPMIELPNCAPNILPNSIPGDLNLIKDSVVGNYVSIKPDYGGTETTNREESDGARAVWAEHLPDGSNVRIIGEWGYEGQGVVASKDDGCSWQIIFPKESYSRYGVPREFAKVNGQLIMVTDNGIHKIDNQFSVASTKNPRALGFLQTLRQLSDGTIIAVGQNGVAISSDLINWQESQGFYKGIMLRTVTQIPGTSIIIAGSWTTPYSTDKQRENVWISFDQGRNFVPSNDVLAHMASIGMDNHINSVLAIEHAGRSLVFIGAEGFFNQGNRTNPNGFPSFAGFEFDRTNNIFIPLNVNAPGLIKAVSGFEINNPQARDLIAPARGIIEGKYGTLIVAAYGAGIATIPIDSIFAGNPLWKTILPREASAGLTIAVGDNVFTGGQVWSRNIAYWPAHEAIVK